MKKAIFLEKPGCASNTRQKAILRAAGVELEVRSLLAEPWTAASLRPFFEQRPVRDWFNPSAPRIKSGEVNPERLNEDQALFAMLADPLLIRRPLIATAAGRMCGFEPHPILSALGVNLNPADDLQSCSHKGEAVPFCPEPAR
jgi:nitrogenase-associated protein